MGPARENWPVWALAVTQTLGYTCMFYIFAALIATWDATLDWGREVLALGPTLAILISASLAVLAGRLVDRGHGPALMGGGSVLGAAALVVLALAGSPAAYLAAWAGLGVAQAACLYEVCFSMIVRSRGQTARAAITRVTLVAGFASTIAFPAGAGLSAAYGWQAAIWVAAAVMVVVVAPLNLWAAHRLETRGSHRHEERARPQQPGTLRRALRNRAFWILAGLFSALSLNHWMLISFLVPVLTERGASAALAVLAASFVGPAQVIGRLALMTFEGRLSTGRATQITIVALVAAPLALMALGLDVRLAFLFALLQGAALGTMTILRPILIAEALGQASYGEIAGAMSIPMLAASAAAPTIGALLLGVGGSDLLIWVAFAMAVATALGAVALKIGRA